MARGSSFDIVVSKSFKAVTQNFFKANPTLKAILPKVVEEEAEFFSKKVADAFAAQKSPMGAWPALSPHTIKKKKKMGLPLSPLLKERGYLRAEVLKSPFKIDKETWFVGARNSAVDPRRGIPLPRRASVHDTGYPKTIKGTAWGNVSIPKRSFLTDVYRHYYRTEHIVNERVSNRIRDEFVKKNGWAREYITTGKGTGDLAMITNL
jgi:hypothetical protein